MHFDVIFISSGYGQWRLIKPSMKVKDIDEIVSNFNTYICFSNLITNLSNWYQVNFLMAKSIKTNSP